MDQPAYEHADDAHLFYSLVLGGSETGDLCAQDPASYHTFPELAHTVQRTWSNRAAAQGRDPCQPELPGEVYFAAAPDVRDDLPFDFGGPQKTHLTGVKLAPGHARTIAVDLFSEADTHGPFDVHALELGGAGVVTYSLDRASGKNGDRLRLTIAADPAWDGSPSFFAVTASLGADSHDWYGIVAP